MQSYNDVAHKPMHASTAWSLCKCKAPEADLALLSMI